MDINSNNNNNSINNNNNNTNSNSKDGNTFASIPTTREYKTKRKKTLTSYIQTNQQTNQFRSLNKYNILPTQFKNITSEQIQRESRVVRGAVFDL